MHVFVFQCGQLANAVFSSQNNAERWIARHKLSGLLTRYDMDEPAFEKRGVEGSLPKRLQQAFDGRSYTTRDVETYVDGTWHRHYSNGASDRGDDVQPE